MFNVFVGFRYSDTMDFGYWSMNQLNTYRFLIGDNLIRDVYRDVYSNKSKCLT